MKHKTVCIILILGLLLNILPLSASAAGMKAHDWALAEVQEAVDFGLVPTRLENKDLTQLITREEFCELVLLLYEKATGTTVVPYSPNPFTDTSNEDILRAFTLEITGGTSVTTFSPNDPITREQCAAMLYRAYEKIVPNDDFSVAGLPDFPDQAYISDYAVQAAKYMAHIGIIKGDKDGYFMPNNNVGGQHASDYGMTTRDAAILMSVRTFKTLDFPEIPSHILTVLPSMTNQFKTNSLLALLPYGRQPETEPADLDMTISALISHVKNVPPEIVDELKIAIKALALNNPIYTPEEVMAILSRSFIGVINDAFGTTFSSDGYMYISKNALRLTPLSTVLAHQLNHALSYGAKKTAFTYRIQNIQGLAWDDRIRDGLADLYAFSALGEDFITLTVNVNSIPVWSRINAPAGYDAEQVSAILFCNALGRDQVGHAYYGTKEDSDLLVKYYEQLTGRSYQEFLGAAEEFVAYTYVFSNKPVDKEKTSQAGKKYMDLILELLEKRRMVTPLDALASEIDALIALSPQLHDTTYSQYYFDSLKTLRASITAK